MVTPRVIEFVTVFRWSSGNLRVRDAWSTEDRQSHHRTSYKRKVLELARARTKKSLMSTLDTRHSRRVSGVTVIPVPDWRRDAG